MNREQVYRDIEDTFGLVPTFLKQLPDSTLEAEWQLVKTLELEEGPIPQKYRELIGLGLAAGTRCQYCTLFHTELARLHGATDKEIEDAVHYAKHTSGWSTYVNGLQISLEEFRQEVEQMVKYARAKAEKQQKAA